MKDTKPFVAVDHGKDQIDLTHLHIKAVLMPIEIHFKDDGDINDEPSMVIVMVNPMNRCICGEISLRMFNEAVAEVGYKLVKDDTIQTT